MNKTAERKRKNGVSWGKYADNEFLKVPKALLRNLVSLDITPGELEWILVVLTYQYHPNELPFVGHERLTEATGKGQRQSQAIGKSLVKKGLLRKASRGAKPDGTRNSNKYDFSQLFERVEKIAQQQGGTKHKESAANQPSNPITRAPSQHEVLFGKPPYNTMSLDERLNGPSADSLEAIALVPFLSGVVIKAGYHSVKDELLLIFLRRVRNSFPRVDYRKAISTWSLAMSECPSPKRIARDNVFGELEEWFANSPEAEDDGLPH